MRVEVDRDLCESNALCVGAAPDVFELDGEDLAVVRQAPVAPQSEADARTAVELCPKMALRLHDG